MNQLMINIVAGLVVGLVLLLVKEKKESCTWTPKNEKRLAVLEERLLEEGYDMREDQYNKLMKLRKKKERFG